ELPGRRKRIHTDAQHLGIGRREPVGVGPEGGHLGRSATCEGERIERENEVLSGEGVQPNFLASFVSKHKRWCGIAWLQSHGGSLGPRRHVRYPQLIPGCATFSGQLLKRGVTLPELETGCAADWRPRADSNRRSPP